MKRILINGTPQSEIRIAQVVDSRVTDFTIEPREQRLIEDNIYLGVVAAIRSDLECAFVDIGEERRGMLSLKDENATEDENGQVTNQRFKSNLNVGEKILVQVDVEPRGEKGASLTTDLSVPGRYIVIKPNSTARGISRNLSEENREKLREVGSQLPETDGIGWILRTSAQNQSIEELKADYHRILNLWNRIDSVSKQNMHKAPVLLFSGNTTMQRVLKDRLHADGTEVHIDEPKLFREAQEYASDFMPELREQIYHYTRNQPLFKAFRVDRQINSAFEREVTLQSGGTLVFDPTEALLSIDVNSAKNTRAKNLRDTALNTNLQAAREVCRQLILRNVGGLVVIDFIDMDSDEARASVEKEMMNSLRRDPARTVCGSISEFGLLELSRQRRNRGPSIYDTHYAECDQCHGGRFLPTVETQVTHFLRDLTYQVLDTQKQNNQFICRLPEQTAVYVLNKEREYLRSLETKAKKQIVIIPDPTLEDASTVVWARHVKALDYEDGSNLGEVVEEQTKKTKNNRRPDIPPEPQEVVKPKVRLDDVRTSTSTKPRKQKAKTKSKPSREAQVGFGGWLKSLFVSEPETPRTKQKSGKSKAKKSDKEGKTKQRNQDARQDRSTKPKRKGRAPEQPVSQKNDRSTRTQNPQRKVANQRRDQSRGEQTTKSARNRRGDTQNRRQSQTGGHRQGNRVRDTKELKEGIAKANRQSNEEIQASRRMPASDRAIGRRQQQDDSANTQSQTPRKETQLRGNRPNQEGSANPQERQQSQTGQSGAERSKSRGNQSPNDQDRRRERRPQRQSKQESQGHGKDESATVAIPETESVTQQQSGNVKPKESAEKRLQTNQVAASNQSRKPPAGLPANDPRNRQANQTANKATNEEIENRVFKGDNKKPDDPQSPSKSHTEPVQRESSPAKPVQGDRSESASIPNSAPEQASERPGTQRNETHVQSSTPSSSDAPLSTPKPVARPGNDPRHKRSESA